MESVLDLLFNPNKQQRPRRTLIYGKGWSGKTCLGASFPRAVFIPTEDGQRDVKAGKWGVTEELRSLPMPKDLAGFMAYLQQFAALPELPFLNLVIDTIDGLHPWIVAKVRAEHDEKERSYGREFTFVAEQWQEILNALEWFNTAKKIGIVLLCHERVEKIDDPTGSPYDQTVPMLASGTDKQKGPLDLVCDWCDEVLWATTKIFKVEKDEGFNKKSHVGVSGDRVLYTTMKATHRAKNRLDMPDEIPLSYSALAAYYPKIDGANINGAVVNGSSK